MSQLSEQGICMRMFRVENYHQQDLPRQETFLVNSKVSNSCCVDLNCYFYTRFGDRPGLNNAVYNQKFSTLLTSQSYFNRLAYSTSVVSNCRETPSDFNFFP